MPATPFKARRELFGELEPSGQPVPYNPDSKPLAASPYNPIQSNPYAVYSSSNPQNAFLQDIQRYVLIIIFVALSRVWYVVRMYVCMFVNIFVYLW